MNESEEQADDGKKCSGYGGKINGCLYILHLQQCTTMLPHAYLVRIILHVSDSMYSAKSERDTISCGMIPISSRADWLCRNIKGAMHGIICHGRP